MQLLKTEKARLELMPGVRTLGQRERTFLLLTDGHRSLQDISKVMPGEADVLVKTLMENGYVELAPSAKSKAANVSSKVPVPSLGQSKDPAKAQAILEPQPPAVSADAFEGKRSLATTRMFLFDICERMFARRDPVLAEHFREALRNARDRESMLAAGRDMIDEIEKIAGHERADSISERIAMLLPAGE